MKTVNVRRVSNNCLSDSKRKILLDNFFVSDEKFPVFHSQNCFFVKKLNLLLQMIIISKVRNVEWAFGKIRYKKFIQKAIWLKNFFLNKVQLYLHFGQ